MKKLLLALLFVCVSVPSQAATRCYSPDEVNAERLLRLHSELMVITVTCKTNSQGRDLVKAYTGFTNRNIRSIKQAEATMSQYYAKAYGGDGIDQLDRLRTRLANEFGQQIADDSAPTFCAQRRDRVTAMYDSPPVSAKDERLGLYDISLSYDPVCKGDKSLVVAQENPTKTAAKPKKTKKKEKS